jgi:hypothetical protein
MKILRAPGSITAASGFLSSEFALAVSLHRKDRIAKRHQGLNMRREQDYRNLASVLLRLATAPLRTVQNWSAESANPASDGETHRVVVGTVVDCDQTFFLTEESSPHAYILTNIARVKTFLGRKVRITGALLSSHVLTVETVNELH